MDTTSPDVVAAVDAQTAALLHTARTLDSGRASSLCAGWTRGHVLTHLARGGDALRNLLEGRAAYAGPDARDAGIEAGATRGAAELAADVRASAAAFRDTALAQSDDAWNRRLTVPGVGTFPASQVLLRRLVEVELHHVDLDAGYRSTDWPTTFNQLELPEPMRGQRADRIV